MAPVSMYVRPYLRAKVRAMVLFPEPDTPSTAMMGFLSKMSLVFLRETNVRKNAGVRLGFSGDFARKVWRVVEEKGKEAVPQFKKKGGFFSPGKTYLCSIAKKIEEIHV